MPDCSPFWYTIDTMQALHGYDYHAFELFGPVHLFWLGLCAALCVGGSLLFRRLGQAGGGGCWQCSPSCFWPTSC